MANVKVVDGRVIHEVITYGVISPDIPNLKVKVTGAKSDDVQVQAIISLNPDTCITLRQSGMLTWRAK